VRDEVVFHPSLPVWRIDVEVAYYGVIRIGHGLFLIFLQLLRRLFVRGLFDIQVNGWDIRVWSSGIERNAPDGDILK